MSAHRMSTDTSFIRRREPFFNQGRELVYYIVIHFVMCRPWLLGCINIESGPLTESVVRIIRNISATRTGVWCHNHDPMLCGITLNARFGNKILFRTGQTGKPVEYRHITVKRQGWSINTKFHRAAKRARLMLINFLPPIKAGMMFKTFHDFLRITTGQLSNNVTTQSEWFSLCSGSVCEFLILRTTHQIASTMKGTRMATASSGGMTSWIPGTPFTRYEIRLTT
ncbi:Uncharacterised protein [Klebsiella pneumoniae]|nr:Uncharacterised protein [Klebsiella pneumoniae]